ncbi:hypothetical protein BGX29_005350 [Mortierella sp. GBA35]|nr:hypothetical protein BGX23_005726 [Mortierella sp. AD031]KAF9101679.1 hypothetical protein BGX29_005350 [Mortierella sp. GBA35]KAG0209887.1 hypothetical protein BGX33_005266 [Mortierella sp. NVP41]
MSQSLVVVFHNASNLEDVERFGKNDPYAQASLDMKTFKKTPTKKNAGKEVTWEETVALDGFNPQENHYLYVDVFDQEALGDEVIGFCAIPLRQVTSAQNHTLRGRFGLYKDNNKPKGEISLTIAITASGQSTIPHAVGEIQGSSEVRPEHQKHISAMKRKEQASDIAALAAFGAAVVGTKYALEQNKINKKAAHEQ